LINFNIKLQLLNEKNNRAHRHRSKEFWGRSNYHLETIKNAKLKIVAHWNYFKGIWRKKNRQTSSKDV
jgi:hypothetical protein